MDIIGWIFIEPINKKNKRVASANVHPLKKRKKKREGVLMGDTQSRIFIQKIEHRIT